MKGPCRLANAKSQPAGESNKSERSEHSIARPTGSTFVRWQAPQRLSPGKRDPRERLADPRTVVVHVPLPGILRRVV